MRKGRSYEKGTDDLDIYVLISVSIESISNLTLNLKYRNCLILDKFDLVRDKYGDLRKAKPFAFRVQRCLRNNFIFLKELACLHQVVKLAFKLVLILQPRCLNIIIFVQL